MPFWKKDKKERLLSPGSKRAHSLSSDGKTEDMCELPPYRGRAGGRSSQRSSASAVSTKGDSDLEGGSQQSPVRGTYVHGAYVREANINWANEYSVWDEGEDPVAATLRRRGLSGVPVFTICVTVVQVSLALLPFVTCPLAPLNLNPMLGPYPTVMDAWGAKNSYKMR